MIAHLDPVHIPPAQLTLNLDALDLRSVHVQTPSPRPPGATLERRSSAGACSLPPAASLSNLPLASVLSPRGPRTTTPAAIAPVAISRGTPRSARGGDWGEDSPAFAGARAERPDSISGSPPCTPTGPPWGDSWNKHGVGGGPSRRSTGGKAGRGHLGPLRGVRWWRACLLWALPWMRQCVPHPSICYSLQCRKCYFLWCHKKLAFASVQNHREKAMIYVAPKA